MKFAKVVPVVIAAVFGLVLSQLTMQDSPVSGQARPFDEVKTIVPEVTSIPDYQPVPKEEGAGYRPPVEQSTDCVCPCDGKCLTEADVRKIVREEFNNQVLAEKQAPRSSIPGTVVYSAPVVQSTPVITYSQPQSTVVRQGVFGRQVYRSSGSCRVVNGQMICN
jgi:hypothetical protein